jgi:hypothetical protein
MIKLNEITIKFTHTEKFDVDSYIEYCEDQETIPSQSHYRDWAIEQMANSLRDEIDENEFKITYSKNKQIVFNKNIENIQEKSEIDCDSCVRCVTGCEKEQFFKLMENNKLSIHPTYMAYYDRYHYKILTLTVEEGENSHYGIIVSDENVIDMRIGPDPFCLFIKMKELVEDLKNKSNIES